MFNFLPPSCLLSVSVEREQEGNVNINRQLSSPCDPPGCLGLRGHPARPFRLLMRGVVHIHEPGPGAGIPCFSSTQTL